MIPKEIKYNLHYDDEIRRLGLMESLHMQHCGLRGCIRTAPPSHTHTHPSTGLSRMGSMAPKEIKYNLHHDDVRGDFLRPPQGTTTATVG